MQLLWLPSEPCESGTAEQNRNGNGRVSVGKMVKKIELRQKVILTNGRLCHALFNDGSHFCKENSWLDEWIRYHLAVGVEHFVLYNDDADTRARINHYVIRSWQDF